MSGRRILITGANGFLGSHVVRAVLASGSKPIAAVRTSSLSRLKDIQKKIRVVKLDVSSRDAIQNVLNKERPDLVIHCAAYGVYPDQKDPAMTFRVNVFGTLALLEAAATIKIKRFLHVGSCFEYKGLKKPLLESDPLEANSAYSASKITVSQLLPRWGTMLGIETLTLRCFSMWGPYEDKNRLVPSLITSQLTKTPCALTPGEQIRDYSYVADMATWIVKLALLRKPYAHPVVNVGSGRGISVKKFATQIAKELKSTALLQFGSRTYRKEEKPSLIADVTRLKKMIGPLKQTALKSGVKKCISLF